MALAPGTYVNVTTAAPSTNGNAPTGTWFVVGQTQAGPTGVPIPIQSMQDYASYLGSRVSYGFLYDALDEFFHDGGVTAYVSRIVGPSASAAHVTLADQGGSPQNTLTITASGAGSWGNSLSVLVAAGTVASSYYIQIRNNGVAVVTSPNLFSPADAVSWFAAQKSWVSGVTVANAGSTNAAPNNNPAYGTFSLTGGTDDTADVTETQWTNGLAVFTAPYGPGQVSMPGHTTNTGFQNLLNHAQSFNRFALLDVTDSATAANLVSQAGSAQSLAVDPSYGAMFGPWVTIPGINFSNPGAVSPVLSRNIPPSAVAAALMSRNDQHNDANNPAAGANGQSVFAINVTQTYSNTDLGTLNAAGVCIFQILNGTVTLMGYRSLATDPNWVFANNARFRMQVINDFDAIGNGFLFQEIDGQGHLFAKFNGALAGKCTQYFTNGSLYGDKPADAFIVNTGPQVNTATTIAAGQLNAQVLLKMSPLAELVTINVIKYLSSQSLPATS